MLNTLARWTVSGLSNGALPLLLAVAVLAGFWFL